MFKLFSSTINPQFITKSFYDLPITRATARQSARRHCVICSKASLANLFPQNLAILMAAQIYTDSLIVE
jgi:hypothetical protein